VVFSIRTRNMTAPCSWRIEPLVTLQKRPKHARLKRGSVTQDFVMGPRRTREGPKRVLMRVPGGHKGPPRGLRKTKRLQKRNKSVNGHQFPMPHLSRWATSGRGVRTDVCTYISVRKQPLAYCHYTTNWLIFF
jgi:hypothetical protein